MARIGALLFSFSFVLSFPVYASGFKGDVAFAKGDYAAAYQDWRASADRGDASAMLAVGTLYDTGHGVQQDFAAALSWYRRSADAGEVRAMFNVGGMYDNGRGTAVDRAEAIRWYGMAAARGSGRAAYNLGVIYRDGDGVPRDVDAAVRFFRIAASDGIRAARANLVALHAEVPPMPEAAAPTRSAGSPIDPGISPWAEAFGKFQREALARVAVDAADLKVFLAMLPTLMDKASEGNGLAEYDLGFAYEHGDGVPRDLVKSYVYYLRATTSMEADVEAPAMAAALQVDQQLTDAEHASARSEMFDLSK